MPSYYRPVGNVTESWPRLIDVAVNYDNLAQRLYGQAGKESTGWFDMQPEGTDGSCRHEGTVQVGGGDGERGLHKARRATE